MCKLGLHHHMTFGFCHPVALPMKRKCGFFSSWVSVVLNHLQHVSVTVSVPFMSFLFLGNVSFLNFRNQTSHLKLLLLSSTIFHELTSFSFHLIFMYYGLWCYILNYNPKNILLFINFYLDCLTIVEFRIIYCNLVSSYHLQLWEKLQHNSKLMSHSYFKNSELCLHFL